MILVGIFSIAFIVLCAFISVAIIKYFTDSF